MEEKDHVNGVGNIVLNLQALEPLLRGFLVEKYGQRSAFPKMGDKIACRSADCNTSKMTISGRFSNAG